MITHRELLAVLSYSPLTGQFRWKKNTPKRPSGSIAGALNSKGYLRISISQKRYFAHRLAWFYIYGDIEEARAAYDDAAKSYFGEFARVA